MRKLRRNIDLQPVRLAEQGPHPLTKRRGATAKIDRDIEDLATNSPHQLPLGVTDLIVQASQRSTNRPGMVVLDELAGQARFLEARLVIRLHEKTARVLEQPGLNQYDPSQGRGGDLHGDVIW